MKRTIASLLAWIVLAGSAMPAEDAQPRQAESQTYENPVLSLLLLPVNMLIRIASVFAPAKDNTPPTDSRPADGSSR